MYEAKTHASVSSGQVVDFKHDTIRIRVFEPRKFAQNNLCYNLRDQSKVNITCLEGFISDFEDELNIYSRMH